MTINPACHTPRSHASLNNLNALSNEIQDYIDEGVLSPEEGRALLETIKALRTQIMVRYAVN